MTNILQKIRDRLREILSKITITQFYNSIINDAHTPTSFTDNFLLSAIKTFCCKTHNKFPCTYHWNKKLLQLVQFPWQPIIYVFYSSLILVTYFRKKNIKLRLFNQCCNLSELWKWLTAKSEHHACCCDTSRQLAIRVSLLLLFTSQGFKDAQVCRRNK